MFDTSELDKELEGMIYEARQESTAPFCEECGEVQNVPSNCDSPEHPSTTDFLADPFWHDDEEQDD